MCARSLSTRTSTTLLRVREERAIGITRAAHADEEIVATLDVKLRAPNGTNVNVKGKQGFDGTTSGSVSTPAAIGREKRA